MCQALKASQNHLEQSTTVTTRSWQKSWLVSSGRRRPVPRDSRRGACKASSSTDFKGRLSTNIPEALQVCLKSKVFISQAIVPKCTTHKPLRDQRCLSPPPAEVHSRLASALPPLPPSCPCVCPFTLLSWTAQLPFLHCTEHYGH